MKRLLKNIWLFRKELSSFTGTDYTESLAFFKRGLELQKETCEHYCPQDLPAYTRLNTILERIITPPDEARHIDVLNKRYKIDHLEYGFTGDRMTAPSDSLPPEVRKRYVKELIALLKHEETLRQQDIVYFGTLLKKHLRRLWL